MNANVSLSCCGIAEISSLDELFRRSETWDKKTGEFIYEEDYTPAQRIRELKSLLRFTRKQGAIYYGVDKECIALAKAAGFKLKGKFLNRGTGNIIHVMLWTKK